MEKFVPMDDNKRIDISVIEDMCKKIRDIRAELEKGVTEERLEKIQAELKTAGHIIKYHTDRAVSI
ncbi:MAG: hypothetical protein IIY21_10950 [Clostridiales bacterium]|nr:hypothetical protein [Clostridiales bacterium]MBQ1571174.1 hypothetical protein [Clostridiales bacterium]